MGEVVQAGLIQKAPQQSFIHPNLSIEAEPYRDLRRLDSLNQATLACS